MIIYENNITTFLEHCEPMNNDVLISQIKDNMKWKIGRGVSPSEERSWRTTLVKISKNLQGLSSKDNQYILLEFKMPLSQKRVDVILVGANGEQKNLLIIELKGWSESFSTEHQGILKINSSYVYVGHPSEEANEYKYLLTEQFSDITKTFDRVEAIALLPNYIIADTDPLYDSQFHEIIRLANIYTHSSLEEFEKIIYQWFNSPISYSNVQELNKLEYKPTLDFQNHLKTQFNNIKLFGSQRTAYQFITSEIKSHFASKTKTLITVSGMPGSGKTVIAFKLLAFIYTKMNKTAKLQLPGPEFRDAVKKHFDKNTFSNMIGGAYDKSPHEVVIIDEAHKAKGQGTAKQFYRSLFANQNFVIVLIDENQVINKSGALKEEVVNYATEHEFKIVNLSLKEQFRNAGDATYIDWLQNWIFNDKDNLQEFYPGSNFNFSVVDDIQFNTLYEKYYIKNNTRTLSFWTQPWNAYLDEFGLPIRSVAVGSSKYTWNPNWKWSDEFVKNHHGTKPPAKVRNEIINVNFNKDKKGSQFIGYFNTTQGSEFDYIFVHLPKLFFLNDENELDVNLNELDLYDMKSQIWMKNKQPHPEKVVQNKRYFLNRLFVNLTRGTKGAFVYCEDKKLQKWLSSKIYLN